MAIKLRLRPSVAAALRDIAAEWSRISEQHGEGAVTLGDVVEDAIAALQIQATRPLDRIERQRGATK